MAGKTQPPDGVEVIDLVDRVEQTPASGQAPATQDDALDALQADLGEEGDTFADQLASPAAPPAESGAGDDELDALLAELGGDGAAQPPPEPPSPEAPAGLDDPSPEAPAGLDDPPPDDLDALVSELGQDSPGGEAEAPASAAVEDELDAFLAELDGEEAVAAETETAREDLPPDNVSAEPLEVDQEVDSDELELLLAELGEEETPDQAVEIEEPPPAEETGFGASAASAPGAVWAGSEEKAAAPDQAGALDISLAQGGPPEETQASGKAEALSLDQARAEAIFERVAREVLEKVVNQSVPRMVAELVAQEIEAIKRESRDSNSGSPVL